MKLITSVINLLFLLLCITAVAMEESKKTTPLDSKFLQREISKKNVMNMVRENGKDDVEVVRIVSIIKISGCFV